MRLKTEQVDREAPDSTVDRGFHAVGLLGMSLLSSWPFFCRHLGFEAGSNHQRQAGGCIIKGLYSLLLINKSFFF